MSLLAKMWGFSVLKALENKKNHDFYHAPNCL
uniref:Uncharacterized protein n=1 Tax=Anguilla anguilla TaxID=7936 RepID=A0A0E9RD98_ANGAN